MKKAILPSGKFLIHNEWTKGVKKQFFDSINPSNEEVITQVYEATEDDVNQAVESARRGFEGEWNQYTVEKRAELLYAIADVITEKIDEIALVETLDSGKPISLARNEILGCAKYFRFYAGSADKFFGTTIPISDKYLDFTLREPLGVTAHITPWNMPMNMICRSVAPALAMGNTVIIKPAEQTPLTALIFANICLELGFPPGVVNVINGYGKIVGETLSRHPGIDGITFTGSVSTGRLIMKAATQHIKPTVLELGGKSPHIIFSDRDIDEAVLHACQAIYSNTGQYCDAGSRLLIEKKIKNEFLDKIIEYSKKITLGPGVDDPQMGPVVSQEHFARVLSYLQLGEKEGAQVVTGGRKSPISSGYFIEPTIFDQVNNKMRIAQEEIFGPVLGVQTFESEEEALHIANDSNYGLAAGIYTSNIDRALRLAKKIKAGYIMINEYHAGTIAAPFGGYKQSGIGRESGMETLSNYTQIKNVILKIKKI